MKSRRHLPKTTGIQLALVLAPNPQMSFLHADGSRSTHSLYLVLEMTCQPNPDTILIAFLSTFLEK